MINKKITGIYEIFNIKNGKRYIGSSIDIPTRFLNHKKNLLENTHSNSHLQRAYNKYGEFGFEYRIVELCDIDNRLEREQFWINSYDRNYLYNINLDVKKVHNSLLYPKEIADVKIMLSENCDLESIFLKYKCLNGRTLERIIKLVTWDHILPELNDKVSKYPHKFFVCRKCNGQIPYRKIINFSYKDFHPPFDGLCIPCQYKIYGVKNKQDIKHANCANCGEIFCVNPRWRRKYCDLCSVAVRKERNRLSAAKYRDKKKSEADVL